MRERNLTNVAFSLNPGFDKQILDEARLAPAKIPVLRRTR